MKVVLCRRHEELRKKKCKVLPVEARLNQHSLLWAEIVIRVRFLSRKECLKRE